jgi:hypothetical protein
MGTLAHANRNAVAAYLRSQRTQTSREVFVRTVVRESHDLTPDECRAIVRECK